MNKIKNTKTVDKPWGWEVWFAQVTGKYLGKILHIKKGESTSLHYHRKKEETLLVQGGILHYTYIDEKGKRLQERLGFGRIIHVLPGIKHALKAGHQDIMLYEVSTCHPDDSVRVEDYYGRECDE